jgi:hypothetical protein
MTLKYSHFLIFSSEVFLTENVCPKSAQRHLELEVDSIISYRSIKNMALSSAACWTVY